MQQDEIIWQIINHSFCSFKTKLAKESTFCQNPYNVTGLCLRSACPLANSRYATIREEDGICYLYMKTIERAHTPKNLWEKIKLPANYSKALEVVSSHLEYFPKYLVHRNKQRLTKIHQMIIRMRKLKLKARSMIFPTPFSLTDASPSSSLQTLDLRLSQQIQKLIVVKLVVKEKHYVQHN
jgi:protein MAK16